MADPFARARFAAAVARKLDGVSYRQTAAAFPTLNVAMISRAARGENLTIGSFLTLCRAFRLKPMSFLDDGVKRRRVTRKAVFKQAVTASVRRETNEAAPR
ncbi:hypothetical protein [Allomesorhizobium alhagi]|uniref:HTH cro/C1-type domain-containing protein n=1 Tax=Mesorhizobium alhagi CCNWXJ12-2 TaxID=1107882 RepID=H0HQW2_9HYPH|nr:hypothetical protein [Mesorhizobium alhagi]EHK56926.1 hypothetical protein MAXJ12_12712 [Mesorhizobium alhagi CCNWXJ12-2]